MLHYTKTNMDLHQLVVQRRAASSYFGRGREGEGGGTDAAK